MNKLFLILIVIFISACSSTGTYFKVGAGYKIDETEIRFDDNSEVHPVSARLELGQEKGNVTYGVSHHSQWFTGPPFNNDMEYHKTEIFIDYKFQL